MKLIYWITIILDLCLLDSLVLRGDARSRRGRSHKRSVAAPSNSIIAIDKLSQDLENNPITNTLDFIWSKQTVAAGDTAVLHCSFDAIFSQLRNGNIDWVRESTQKEGGEDAASGGGTQLLASGKKVVYPDKRYRVYRPHHSALSVLIIRRAKKRDAGIFRCNLSGSSTRHKFLVLNVTESKIEAQTSPARLKARMGKEVTLWCNATGYPQPIVYWTREDRNRKLPDGSYQYWGNGLVIREAMDTDTGIYACYLDNFVQPVVSYKFSLMVEDRPWEIDAFKMRFDSSEWHRYDSNGPKPVQGKSYLLMCETRGSPKPMPKMRWFRDGKPVRNNRHFYIIEDQPEWRAGYTSSTLVVMRFVPRFQGNYTCVASNVFRIKQQTFSIEGYIPNEEYTTESPYIVTKPDETGTKARPETGPNNFEGSADDDLDDDTSRSDTGENADLPVGPSDDEDFSNVLSPEPGSGNNQYDGIDLSRGVRFKDRI